MPYYVSMSAPCLLFEVFGGSQTAKGAPRRCSVGELKKSPILDLFLAILGQNWLKTGQNGHFLGIFSWFLGPGGPGTVLHCFWDTCHMVSEAPGSLGTCYRVVCHL